MKSRTPIAIGQFIAGGVLPAVGLCGGLLYIGAAAQKSMFGFGFGLGVRIVWLALLCGLPAAAHISAGMTALRVDSLRAGRATGWTALAADWASASLTPIFLPMSSSLFAFWVYPALLLGAAVSVWQLTQLREGSGSRKLLYAAGLTHLTGICALVVAFILMWQYLIPAIFPSDGGGLEVLALIMVLPVILIVALLLYGGPVITGAICASFALRGKRPTAAIVSACVSLGFNGLCMLLLICMGLSASSDNNLFHPQMIFYSLPLLFNILADVWQIIGAVRLRAETPKAPVAQ